MQRLILSAIIMACCCAPALAQKTFKKALGNMSGKQRIQCTIESASFEVIGYNGTEVIIEAEHGYEGPPERAKGLKPLYNTATDNTGIGLEVQEAGGVMNIKQATHNAVSYKIKIPASASISIEETGWMGGEYSISDTNGEIEFEGHNSGITLKNVTGPIVAKSTNGDIEVVFSRLNPEKPSDINVTNGHIDVTLPADTKANVAISSINGEAYSDFDIQREGGNEKKVLHKRDISGKINGGGVELSLSTINSDIYLRKK